MPEWEAADQRVLRNSIPENRLRVYDVRELISNMADTDSVLELRPFFGLAMVTSLVRIEGRSVGVVANNCMHLSGAIDADAADKATRFIKCALALQRSLMAPTTAPSLKQKREEALTSR